MKEILITFETAKLAKEKGFDVQTYSNCWLKTLDGDIIHSSEREDKLEHERCKQYLMQPSQALLQRWLRGIQELYIEVFFQTGRKFGFRIYDLSIEDDIEMIKGRTYEFGNYFSYEEALEYGLIESLKLIKS